MAVCELCTQLPSCNHFWTTLDTRCRVWANLGIRLESVGIPAHLIGPSAGIMDRFISQFMVRVHEPGRIALTIGVTVPICLKPHRRCPARIGNPVAASAQPHANQQGPSVDAGYRVAGRFGWSGDDLGAPRVGWMADGWLDPRPSILNLLLLVNSLLYN